MFKQLGPLKLAIIGVILLIFPPMVFGTASIISTGLVIFGLIALVASIIYGIEIWIKGSAKKD